MAAPTKVVERYAKSLLSLALEQGQLDGTYNDVERINSTLHGSKELSAMLRSPVVPSEKKLSIIKAVFDGVASPMILNFFELMSRRGREQDLPAVMAEFKRQYLERQGIVQGTAVSPVELSDRERQAMQDQAEALSGKRVQLSYTVDPDLIGGYLLRVGDRQIDQSVRSQLERMRLTLKDTTYQSQL